MPVPRPLKWVLAITGFVAFAALLLNAAPLAGKTLAVLYEGFLPVIYPRFDSYQVELVQRKSEWVYLLQANNARPFAFGEMVLPANIGPSSSTLLAHSVQHLLFFGLVVAAGLARSGCRPLRLLVAALALLLLLELLDVPFVLSGALEDLMAANFGSDGPASEARIKWMDFLNNGGRIGLSLGFAWLALVVSAPVARTGQAPAT